MRPSLYRYVWDHTRRQQIWMLVIVVLSTIPLYFSLNLPKLIINGPIQGGGFEEGVGDTDVFFRIALPGMNADASERILFPGLEMERLQALFVLSMLFLTLVVINGAFKFYLNIYKGRLGERMLRRMRYELVDKILRFPMRRFRRVRPAEIASMIKDELEPVGGFIGDAFIQPVYLGSQILTAMVFIFLQSITLGFVALAVMLVQVAVIPRMRRRLLVLGRERQLAARKLAGSVGEIIESMPAIRTNDGSNYIRARMSDDLGKIFLIRFDIYQWKFFVKFLNNFLSQATPFIFYMFGGYFAVTGQLNIGELVAVIAAYRELPGPLKDLIDWDLMRLDVNVKYEQVAEQFDVEGLVETTRQAPMQGSALPLSGEFRLEGVTVRDESGINLIHNLDLDLPLQQLVAAIGPVGDGAETVAEILSSLSAPAEGSVTLGGQRLASIPESVLGRRIAFVDTTTYFPQSTLRQALLFPLMHQLETASPPPATKREKLARHESAASGNSLDDPAGDWVDHSAIGITSEDRLSAINSVLQIVQLGRDIRRIGLAARLPEQLAEQAHDKVLRARGDFWHMLRQSGLESTVERFDTNAYLTNASILENIVFGASRHDESAATMALVRGDARRVLFQTGLDRPLLDMGRKIAETLVELFGDMGQSSPLLRRISLIQPEEIDSYRQILGRLEGRPTAEATNDDKFQLARLALRYIEPQHRMGLIDADLQEQIVTARQLFRTQASPKVRDEIVFYDEAAFNPAASIKDNIIFGRMAKTTTGATEAVETHMADAIARNSLDMMVLDAALEFDIGSGAKRLSVSQQQRLALARALLKQPDYLIANRCLSALDSGVQKIVLDATLLRARLGERPFGIYWVLGTPSLATAFDRSLQFKGGQIVEDTGLASEPQTGLSSEEALPGAAQ
ncbi:ATP-binding cassette domain-containing protein [Aureimonas fodinaquatilis]|uniref:ATP-binding cassette domain-containing protein n=1 Tax=Aureimonas fodinaquatilis TaxID=2565783 RepID=A0A5B0DR97_9HYPH|nr:ABC transporter transmembrane domain-containing protein [Aureimonas fodinaquatilis]KAA0968998.1 ATP-binding cassette domain-containing protein [Aureimonas fodinaquatilis]